MPSHVVWCLIMSSTMHAVMQCAWFGLSLDQYHPIGGLLFFSVFAFLLCPLFHGWGGGGEFGGRASSNDFYHFFANFVLQIRE